MDGGIRSSMAERVSDDGSGSEGPGLLMAGVDAVRQCVAPGALSGPDVVPYAAGVSVWGRWFVWLDGVLLLPYRPGFWYPGDIEFLALPVLVGVLKRPGARPAPLPTGR